MTIDNVDAKKILPAIPPEDWKRPPGRPEITWMKTVLNDLESHSLTLTEAVNMAQNRPLWRLLATSGTTHSVCRPEMMMMMSLSSGNRAPSDNFIFLNIETKYILSMF